MIAIRFLSPNVTSTVTDLDVNRATVLMRGQLSRQTGI